MGRLTAAALAVLLSAGACGGGGDDSGEGAGAVTSTSAATAPGPATTGPAADPSSASPGSGRTPGPPRSGTAGASTAPPTTASPAPPPPAGLAFTPLGTYRYATTGRFSSTLGAPQARDGESTLTVDPPSGADQHSVRQGPGRTTDQVLRLDSGGAYLVSLRQVEQGLTKEVRPSPPALALPAGAAPGRTWSWRATSTDGQTTVDSRFTAARTEEVTVGADRVTALVVEVVLQLTGDVVSTSRQTLWVSLRHSLVVRQDDATEGRLGAIGFSSTSSDRLLSLGPA